MRRSCSIKKLIRPTRLLRLLSHLPKWNFLFEICLFCNTERNWVKEFLNDYLNVKFPGFEDITKGMDPIEKPSLLFLLTIFTDFFTQLYLNFFFYWQYKFLFKLLYHQILRLVVNCHRQFCKYILFYAKK